MASKDMAEQLAALMGKQRDPYSDDSPYLRYSLATIALSNMKFDDAAVAVSSIKTLLAFILEAAEKDEPTDEELKKIETGLGGYL